MFYDIELSESESAHFECIQNSAELPFLLFWLGAGALTWYIARQNNFGLIDALRAAAGLKKFPRTTLINVLNILVVFIPITLIYYLVQMNCK